MKQCYLVYSMPSLFIFEYARESHCCHIPITHIVFHVVRESYFQNDKDFCPRSTRFAASRPQSTSYNLRSEVHCMQSVISVVCSLRSAVSAVCRYRYLPILCHVSHTVCLGYLCLNRPQFLQS